MKIEGEDAVLTGIVLILMAAFCAAVLIATAIYVLSIDTVTPMIGKLA